MKKLYPINNWAYIADSQINHLLKLVKESTFNSKGENDIYDQVRNYINYRWQYISDNKWLLFSEDKMQVAFNMGLKSNIELGDDYVFAVFSKNDSSQKQDWRLLCFAIRGKTTKIGATSININLYNDESRPIFTPKIPTKFRLSFGFNHLFNDDKDRLERIPKNILNTFNGLENNSTQRALFCSLIKFAILNDSENISEYSRMGNGEKRVTTSFDPDRFLRCLNVKENSNIPKGDRVLNELPISYMYPVNIQDPNRPDCAMVFRKKGRGKYTQFIGKTILDLANAQMNARICHPNLEDTWLSNENVNRNYEK